MRGLNGSLNLVQNHAQKIEMPVITTSRRISDKTFAVSCAALLKSQADWLLATLEKVENERGRGFLEDGTSIQIGWSMVTIRREGDNLVVVEPNFAGNPFQETNPDLTCTLSVQAQQNSVLHGLGLEGLSVSFKDKVIFSSGSLEKSHVYLERQIPKQGDSGWYISEVDATPSELKAAYVYQLLRLRPAFLQVLALPMGYMAVFTENRIETILNERNEPLDVKVIQ